MHEYCTIAASYTKELQNQTGKRGSEGKEVRDRMHRKETASHLFYSLHILQVQTLKL